MRFKGFAFLNFQFRTNRGDVSWRTFLFYPIIWSAKISNTIARQVEEVQNIYLTMRGWRHDYHNHLQSMKAYVEMGQYVDTPHS